MRTILRKTALLSSLAAVMAFGAVTSSAREAEAGSYYGFVKGATTLTVNGTAYFAFRHVSAPGYPSSNFYWIVPATDAGTATLATLSLSQSIFNESYQMAVTVSCTTCNLMVVGGRTYWVPEKISMGNL